MAKIKIHRNLAKLKNIELFYLDTRTKGPAILCLHGRWGRAETWVDFMERYGQRYRIIAPDQRGHGLSGKPASNYTAEEMAIDIIELLDELKIDSVLAVGHLMGGRIAGYLTALYPEYVKALAILDRSASGLVKTGTPPSDPLSTVDPLTRDWPLPFSSLSDSMSFIRQFTDSELSYQYFMNSLVETVDGYRMLFSSQAMAAGMAHDFDWFHLLPEIKCPVLLIRAKGNDAVSDKDFAKMQSLLLHCMTREVSHPDHNVHLANKEEFHGYFDEFLKKTEGWPLKCD